MALAGWYLMGAGAVVAIALGVRARREVAARRREQWGGGLARWAIALGVAGLAFPAYFLVAALTCPAGLWTPNVALDRLLDLAAFAGPGLLAALGVRFADGPRARERRAALALVALGTLATLVLGLIGALLLSLPGC